MYMKRTLPLKVMVDSSFPLGKVVIHPNEGFDLGLMQTSYPAKVFMNISLSDFQQEAVEPVPGQIYLENACRKGHVELSKKCWELMGGPDHVLLVYNEARVLLLSVKKPQ